MQLKKTHAQKIVNELNTVLEASVNLMDDTGIILASSTPERVGNLHGGAKRMLTEDLDELYIQESEYEGAKKGLNYLIRVQGQTVGVIGISGAYEEIVKPAQIIKRMTELLVMEMSLTEKAEQRKYRRKTFLEEWLLTEYTVIEPAFLERGKSLGVDIRLPRMVCALSIQPKEEVVLSIEEEEKYRSFLEKEILKKDSKALLLHSASVIFACTTFVKQVIEWWQEIQRTVSEALPVELKVAVGGKIRNPAEARNAAVHAQKALRVICRNGEKHIEMYENLSWELLSQEIPEKAKKEFIEKVFPGFSEGDQKETLAFLKIFYEENGSITKTAARLYIHKNTVQNRLLRIWERTGLDPRVLKDAALIETAILFCEK